jgi:hypothetical protein
MKPMKLHLALALGTAMLATSAFAGPKNWPLDFPTRVKTKPEVLDCCLPKEKVALACKDCKTLNEKAGTEKKGILSWFQPDSKHGCSGCGGKITVRQVGKTQTVASYEHVCSKCGPKSAFTCATHKI